MTLTTQLVLGFLLAVSIAYLAYCVHSLSRDGVIAAAFVGTIIFGLGGLQWSILLLAFFISSSALSRLFKDRKRGLNEKFSKGSERDAGQVLGNGGLATAFVLLNAIFPHQLWTWVGFAAALASVNADTWATELGTLNPNPPRMITDLKNASKPGLRAEYRYGEQPRPFWARPLSACLPRFFIQMWIGHSLSRSRSVVYLARSLTRSSAQRCKPYTFVRAIKGKPRSIHFTLAARKRFRFRGWKWLNNDWVNFACGAFGVLIIFLLTTIMSF